MYAYSTKAVAINNIGVQFKNLDKEENAVMSDSIDVYMNSLDAINNKIQTCCNNMKKQIKSQMNRSDTGSLDKEALKDCYNNIEKVRGKLNYRFKQIRNQFDSDYKAEMNAMLAWWKAQKAVSDAASKATDNV